MLNSVYTSQRKFFAQFYQSCEIELSIKPTPLRPSLSLNKIKISAKSMTIIMKSRKFLAK